MLHTMNMLARWLLGVVGLVIFVAAATVSVGVFRSDMSLPAKLLAAAVPLSGLLVVALTGVWMNLPSASDARFLQVALATKPLDPAEARRWRVARVLLVCWIAGGLGLIGFILLAQSGWA
jgi:hypothetical protein